MQKAFETICDLEDVEFPTGDAQRAGRQGRVAKGGRVLGAISSKLLPEAIDPETTCKTQERAVRFRRELRIAESRRRHRAATLAQSAAHLGGQA